MPLVMRLRGSLTSNTLNCTALAPMASTRCSCMLAHTDLLAGKSGSAAASASPLSEPAAASH